VNVSQRSHDEKSFERMMCTWINHSTWYYRLSLNPHALAIYLEFVPTRGATPERF
jgi:hypothetical protein